MLLCHCVSVTLSNPFALHALLFPLRLKSYAGEFCSFVVGFVFLNMLHSAQREIKYFWGFNISVFSLFMSPTLE